MNSTDPSTARSDAQTNRSAHESPLSRRALLGGVAAAGVAGLAGCAGDESASISPVSIDEDQACDQCGMIVSDHPGTVGQVHFEDDEPEGGRPAQFCSGTCTYRYRFDAEDQGRTALATFLTDYSARRWPRPRWSERRWKRCSRATRFGRPGARSDSREPANAGDAAENGLEHDDVSRVDRSGHRGGHGDEPVAGLQRRRHAPRGHVPQEDRLTGELAGHDDDDHQHGDDDERVSRRLA